MKWMVTLSFKEKPDSQAMALIPAEQAHVAELMSQEIVEARYLSTDYSAVWLVMHSESREKLDALLLNLPMYHLFDIVIALLR